MKCPQNRTPEEDMRVDEAEAAERAPRGKKRFTQVYDKGWDTIAHLAENAMALRVYTFIAKHCDHLNALVCAIEVMAEEFDCNERTIRRATKWLEEQGYLTIVKIGTANAYVLDPLDIWKNYDRYKNFCAFNTRTLASKAQNKMLKSRLTHMRENQRDLFGKVA
jgi:hypothetical protein